MISECVEKKLELLMKIQIEEMAAHEKSIIIQQKKERKRKKQFGYKLGVLSRQKNKAESMKYNYWNSAKSLHSSFSI